MPVYREKRIWDVALSCAGMTICLPLILLAACVLFLLSGSFPFFLQPRVGQQGKVFTLIKLKTLYPAGQPCLQKVGFFLRKYSIDELPQLLNVLRGDMSLIGPRPLLVEYLPLYTAWQNRRHCVKPGMTGWAQINGRNGLRWEEKFALDIWYVDHLSLRVDLRIIFLTLFCLLDPQQVKPEGLSEQEKFKGSLC